MQDLSIQQEKLLTGLQAREFLEERRGLYHLSDKQISDFCSLIYLFENKLNIKFSN
jgi:hypothetical protein